MRLWRMLLILSLVIGISFAAPVNLTSVVPITAVTVAIFLAIMSLLGKTLSSPQLDAWVKTELRELIAGVILVVIVYTFFISSKGVSAAMTGSGDYINESVRIINNMLSNESVGYDRAMHDIIKAGTKIRAAATYAPYLSIPLWYVMVVYSTSPLSGVGLLFSPLSAATQGIANSIFLYEGIALLLRFSATAIPAVLLPISLAFRLVPYTRKMGNTLIAVCLAAMVLLPFSVIIVGQVNKIIDYPQAYLKNSQLNALDANTWAMTIAEPFCKIMPIRFILSLNDFLFSLVVCGPLLLIPVVGAFLFSLCQPLMQNTVYPIMMLFLQVAYDSSLLLWMTAAGEGKAYANTAFEILNPFLAQVNNLVLLGYIDLIVIAIITISGARSISAALGGEWYLAGIQRLV